MCPTRSAVYLRAQHKEKAAILFGLDVLVVYGRVKARPARARIVLRLGPKERCAASDTAINAFLLIIPILPRKGPLRAVLPGDPILLGGELLAPFFFGLLYFLCHKSILACTFQSHAKSQQMQTVPLRQRLG